MKLKKEKSMNKINPANVKFTSNGTWRLKEPREKLIEAIPFQNRNAANFIANIIDKNVENIVNSQQFFIKEINNLL